MMIDFIEIVFCYSKKGVIEFRDLNNLDKILYTHSVAPKKPGRLSQVSPSVLLYVCGNLVKPELHWLDCSVIPPKENRKKDNIFPAAISFWEMCFVSEETNRKRLIIISPEVPQGIHAYNVDTNSLEWKKEIEGMGKAAIVSDGHGHLFVCDWDNNCIHMVSVPDGQYLGCLMKSGDQGLGSSRWAAWSEETSSLIVIHTNDKKFFISVINVQ